ncbi:hypothetical protein ALC56_04262 [Trachymyrmex septentrionalis]|uniref:Uncharacterized protein n=1 Tax=Trachymyrmex septentrionalis TaxID=34720 RepID=A0A195FL89_9HYME|nr:hypothetical protein ALC56_04262 [Trachymyrmex septentrionalis]
MYAECSKSVSAYRSIPFPGFKIAAKEIDLKRERERREETKSQRAGQRESRATREERERDVQKEGERRGRQEGEREGMVVVSSLQCIAFTNPPSPVTPRALPPSSSYEKVESWRPAMFSSRFSLSSVSLARTLIAAVDRFEGYGVIKRLLNREESRGEKERNRSRRNCNSIISVRISEYTYPTG